MGFSKLREWVGTMTGKGDRWGRGSVGRSEPAFMAASITALPPPTCTARGRQHRQLLFCCEAGHLRPLFLRGLCRAENPLAALPAAVLFCRLCVCLPPVACHPHFLHQFLQGFIHCASFAPVSFHVRQDRRVVTNTNMFASCKTAP